MKKSLPLLVAIASLGLVACSSEPVASSSGEGSASDTSDSVVGGSDSTVPGSDTSSEEVVTPSVSIREGLAATIGLDETLVLHADVVGIDAIPVWSVAVNSVATLSSTTGTEVTLTPLTDGVTMVSVTAGELSASITVTVEKTSWYPDEAEMIEGVILGESAPYWADGLDYMVGYDSYGDIQIVVEDFDAADLYETIVPIHEADGWAETDDSQPDYIMMEKTLDDYSVIGLETAVVDADNYIITEGTGTLILFYYVSAETMTEWPAELLDSYIEYYVVEGETGIPAPTTAAEVGYQVVAGGSLWTGYYVDLMMIDHEGDYGADLAAAGWTLIEGLYTDTSTDASIPYYYNETAALGAVILETVNADELPVTLVEFVANEFIVEWPAEDIATFFEDLITDVPAIPEADLTGIDYLQVYGSTSYGTYSIYCYGASIVDSYTAALEAANWTCVFEDPSTGYVTYEDPTGALYVEIGYDADYEDTDIIFSVADGSLSATWNVDAVAAAAQYINPETSSVIPAPTFAYDYVSVVIDDFYEVAEITVLSFDAATGALVDHTADYEADLKVAGWTYDVASATYVSPAEDLALTVEFDEEYGLIITPVVYNPAYATWPTEVIASGMTSLGLTTTVPEITIANGGFYVETDVDAGYMAITINGATEAEMTAYGSTLTDAGYTAYSSPLFTDSVYVSADAEALISFMFDEEEGAGYIYVELTSAYDAEMAYADLVDSAVYWYVCPLPELTIPTGNIALSGTSYSSNYDPIYYFSFVGLTSEEVDALADEFEAGLSEWTKAETPTAGTGATATYTIETSDSYGDYSVVMDIYKEADSFSFTIRNAA